MRVESRLRTIEGMLRCYDGQPRLDTFELLMRHEALRHKRGLGHKKLVDLSDAQVVVGVSFCVAEAAFLILIK